jgi:hypothetical protein
MFSDISENISGTDLTAAIGLAEGFVKRMSNPKLHWKFSGDQSEEAAGAGAGTSEVAGAGVGVWAAAGFGAACFLATAVAVVGDADAGGFGDGVGLAAAGAGEREAEGDGSAAMMLTAGVDDALGNSALVGLPAGTPGVATATDAPAGAGGAFHTG